MNPPKTMFQLGGHCKPETQHLGFRAFSPVYGAMTIRNALKHMDNKEPYEAIVAIVPASILGLGP